jgi:diacylglycerol kinase (ATP)
VPELVSHQLNIANGSHHAGGAIARDTGLEDRQLVVYPLGDADRLRLTLVTVRQAVTGPRRHAFPDRPPGLPGHESGHAARRRRRDPRPQAQITLEANALRVMVRTDFPDA